MTRSITTAAMPPRKMGGPQWLALAAGMIVIGATIAILAGDALATGKWGQDQWLGLVILAATIAFGLLRKRAWGEGKWASAIAFAVMFGLGTVLLVYSSMGRQEAARADRAQGAKNANAAIASLRSEQKRIEGDIAEAGRLKAQSDEAVAAYEKALADARANAQAIATQMREKQAADAEARRKTLEDELNAKLMESEKIIAAGKQAAMSNVRGIAEDATRAIVERLIGSAPSEQAVADAVTGVLKS